MQSTSDIIKYAIEHEVKAKVFYTEANELASKGESMMVFLELIEMEEAHARHLVDVFGDLLKADGVDGEAFLAELESRTHGVLGDNERKLLEDADMKPVLEFAMAMEEKARDAYKELATRMDDAKLRELCNELAQEEQEHYELLAEARIGADSPMDDRPML
jgi:rubrerythrin